MCFLFVWFFFKLKYYSNHLKSLKCFLFHSSVLTVYKGMCSEQVEPVFWCPVLCHTTAATLRGQNLKITTAPSTKLRK